MIRLSTRLPRRLFLAVSGGVDSMAALHFLSKNHEVTVVHFNHKEGNSDAAETLVRNYCASHGHTIIVESSTNSRPAGKSLEEHWRDERYALFHSFDEVVVTAHTLDDCVETWIWSSLHGCGKIIPASNRNVLRPFRLTRKQFFIDYAQRHNVPHIEDSSNADLSLTRNYIRRIMMPNVLQVNPGIHKTILKKVLNHV